MDKATRLKLMVVKEQLISRAVVIENYSADGHTLNSVGERTNATYLQNTLWDIARIIELLLKETE